MLLAKPGTSAAVSRLKFSFAVFPTYILKPSPLSTLLEIESKSRGFLVRIVK